jgi:hypothetical protein
MLAKCCDVEWFYVAVNAMVAFLAPLVVRFFQSVFLRHEGRLGTCLCWILKGGQVVGLSLAGVSIASVPPGVDNSLIGEVGISFAGSIAQPQERQLRWWEC